MRSNPEVTQVKKSKSHTFAQSGHKISGPSVIKPLPTKLPEQAAQAKQSLCQLRSSNDTNLAPPIPVNRMKKMERRLVF